MPYGCHCHTPPGPLRSTHDRTWADMPGGLGLDLRVETEGFFWGREGIGEGRRRVQRQEACEGCWPPCSPTTVAGLFQTRQEKPRPPNLEHIVNHQSRSCLLPTPSAHPRSPKVTRKENKEPHCHTDDTVKRSDPGCDPSPTCRLHERFFGCYMGWVCE